MEKKEFIQLNSGLKLTNASCAHAKPPRSIELQPSGPLMARKWGGKDKGCGRRSLTCALCFRGLGMEGGRYEKTRGDANLMAVAINNKHRSLIARESSLSVSFSLAHHPTLSCFLFQTPLFPDPFFSPEEDSSLPYPILTLSSTKFSLKGPFFPNRDSEIFSLNKCVTMEPDSFRCSS